MTKILLENKTGITFIPCLLTLIILTLQCILHDFLKKKNHTLCLTFTVDLALLFPNF